MANFTKISATILATREELRRYLSDARTIAAANRGGTFVGNRDIAPDSLREFGIILPKGGMILPHHEPEEIRDFLNAAKKVRERAQKHAALTILCERRRLARALGARVVGRKVYLAPIGGQEIKILLLESGTISYGDFIRWTQDASNVIERITFLQGPARRIAEDAASNNCEVKKVYAGEWQSFCAGAYINIAPPCGGEISFWMGGKKENLAEVLRDLEKENESRRAGLLAFINEGAVLATPFWSTVWANYSERAAYPITTLEFKLGEIKISRGDFEWLRGQGVVLPDIPEKPEVEALD